MIHPIQLLRCLGAALVLPLVLTSSSPAQAASLIFTNDPSQQGAFDFNFGAGTGGLFLRGVLTEPGTVTTQYSAIRAAAITPFFGFEYRTIPPVAFPNPRELIFSFDPNRDATFTFNNGNLVEIFYTSDPQQFSFVDGRFCRPTGGCIAGIGFVTLFLEGDRYRQFVSVRATEFSQSGQIINVFENSGNFSSGPINIRNSGPIAAVPEPTTILGTGLVVALGAAVKRRRDRLKK